jgi:hypothetical protein
MKFWELISVCRDEPELLERLADSPDWAEYVDWWRNERVLIVNQDRDKLDHQLPDDLCRHVLTGSNVRYRILQGHVRWAANDTEEQTYRAIEIYDRYGGSALEEVKEFGSYQIQP